MNDAGAITTSGGADRQHQRTGRLLEIHRDIGRRWADPKFAFMFPARGSLSSMSAGRCRGDVLAELWASAQRRHWQCQSGMPFCIQHLESPEQRLARYADRRISGFNPPAGTLNFEMEPLVGGVASTDETVPVSYNVASSGRGTLSYTLNAETNNYVVYLYDSNSGFMLQTDAAGSGQFGTFEPQDIVPFNNALIDGTFAGGAWFNPLSTSPNVAAQYSFGGSNVSATTPTGALTGSYTVSATGRGTSTVSQPVFGSNPIVFYVISATAMAVMGADAVTGHGDAVSYLHQ